MDRQYYLLFKTYNKDYMLPFINLEYLDTFTMGFKNNRELINFFKDTFNIDMISEILISDGSNKSLRIPIRYEDDNYDSKKLKDYFKKFILEKPLRAKNFDIIFVDTIHDYIFEKGKVSFPYFTKKVDEYINNHNGYKTLRDIYFGLLSYRLDLSCIMYKNKENNIDKSITSFKSDDNELNDLIYLAKTNDNYLDEIEEYLHGKEIDELKKLKHDTYYYVDGLCDNNNMKENLDCLYLTTNMNFDEIISIFKSVRKR